MAVFDWTNTDVKKLVGFCADGANVNLGKNRWSYGTTGMRNSGIMIGGDPLYQPSIRAGGEGYVQEHQC